jgi:Ni,Fe-hydrogenase III large subunit
MTGVGPAAASLRFCLDERWTPADDIGQVGVFVIAGAVDDPLAAAAVELRRQIPADVPTLWVCAPGEERSPALARALARAATLRIAELGPDDDLAGTWARARAHAPLGDEPIAHEIPRLFEPEGESDLATEDLVLSLGPIHPALATPLRLVLVLDGEQVRDVIRDEGYARRRVAAGGDRHRDLAAVLDPATPATARLAVAVAAAGPDNLGPLVAAAERERAAHHLLACARHLWLLGMISLARELADLAREARREHGSAALAERIERVRARLASRFGPMLRMRGVGALDASQIRDTSVSGPVARASGVAADARADGSLAPLYERLGFTPVVASDPAGDDAARFGQRLAEAAQAIRLAAAVDGLDRESARQRGDAVEIESPRGRVVIPRSGDGAAIATPSTALLGVVKEVLVGTRYADALVVLDGLDASAEEAEMAA